MNGGDELENEWSEQGEDSVPRGKSMAQREVCKPDYDGMIKSVRDQNDLILGIYNAVVKAVYQKTRINGLNRTSLKNLLGQCYVQLLNNEHTVDELISQQEAD